MKTDTASYIAALLVVIGTLFLGACSQQTNRPQNTVESYYQALQQLNFTGAYQLLADDNRADSLQTFTDSFQINDDENRLRLLMQNFTVIDVQQKATSAIVQIELNIPQIQTFDLLVPEIKANLENKNYAAVEQRMRTLVNFQKQVKSVALIFVDDQWLITRGQ